ncbi:hypothetical protein HYPSUDRAFT_163339 [Hypholoma sublateritium FD-334 SS-4]|uniref:PWWP domain-containing protein n=1 Tax=Hypholoma sublateritium (strain FD-334 SS-4) TaxID=945553 RepID=A0A0D2MIA9_HYPSF|nr:hypothetical protein HYPSUDRAFT_163339 [Hypholoma sublateritium FD-334 SS-4]
MSKKAPKSAKEVRKYNIGDPVLGKMRGYAPWPGIIVDPADAPPVVQRDQPPNKRSTTYCILFFPQGDYGWLSPNDLSFLQRGEIEAFLADETKKRNNNLRMGYRIALDPAAWMTERAVTAAAAQEAEENAQVDQLASDEDEDAAATGDDPEAEEDADADADAMDLDVGLGLVEGKKAKKTKGVPGRKRKRDSDAAESKPAKPAKAKKAAEPKAKKTPADKEKKPRKNGANAKNKALVESEDEAAGGDHGDDGDAPAGSSKKAARDAATPPPTKKARRDREEEDECMSFVPHLPFIFFMRMNTK